VLYRKRNPSCIPATRQSTCLWPNVEASTLRLLSGRVQTVTKLHSLLDGRSDHKCGLRLKMERTRAMSVPILVEYGSCQCSQLATLAVSRPFAPFDSLRMPAGWLNSTAFTATALSGNARKSRGAVAKSSSLREAPALLIDAVWPDTGQRR
jgi:hypothetical protein